MVNTAARATSPPINQSQTSIVTSSSSLQQYQSLNNGNNNSNSSNNSKQFCDNFWGEKINGFDILCQNLKHSLTSVKDLETFLRESANCEDSYGKVLNKLVTQINRFSTNGSFNPLWSPLKELNEKYASKHVEMVHSLHEVIKDIQRYNDELSKKIKKIRENEIQTQNIVQSFQEVQLLLNKTKEQYHNLCIEYEKQKRQLDPQQLAQYQQQQLQQQISSTNLLSTGNPSASGSLLNGTANLTTSLNPLLNTNNSNINLQSAANSGLNSQPVVQSPSPAPTSTTDRLSSLASSITVSKVSQVQKAEKKLRLALEEYKLTIDKYNTIRVDFERKLAESCEHFQYAEDTHLKQMRVFVDSYSKLITNVNLSKQQIYSDFQTKFEQYTSDYLLQLFVDNKKTGTERPEIAQFVDQFDYAKLATNNQNGITSPNGNNNATLINETDFNLFINGGNQFTNTSLNTSYLSSNSNSLVPPPPPMLSSTQPSFSQQNSVNSLLTSSITNDTTDNRTNGTDFNTNGNRGTPTFFSSANIMGSNSFYSQLTNSVSTTTLNSIQQPTIGTIVSNSSAIGTASPINFPANNASTTQNNSTTATTTENMKRSDSKGINIFNVDFLGRNKNKEKKAAQKAAAAAAVTAVANEPNNIKSKQIKNTKKTKQNLSVSTNQYENLNSTSATATFTNGGLSVSNNSNRDSSSINSEDSNERASDQNMVANTLSQIDSVNQNNQQGSITARSISSITGSLSFDLLDQLKISNGSDIDSEGYSIRPESSSGLSRKKKGEPLRNKDNEDMNNLYASSTTNSDSDDSDSENGDGGGPLKVNIKIKPKSEVVDEKKTNDAVLREISKNLQLIKPVNPQLNSSKQQAKKRTYYYNYGTSNPDQASSGWSTSISDGKTPENETGVNSMMTRSVSVGSVAHSSNLLGDLTFNSSGTKTNNSESLFDFGLSFGPTANTAKPVSNNQTITPSIPNSMSLNKVNETNLYNIEEDKEVESSFQYDLKRGNNYVSSSPANTSSTSTTNNNPNNSMVQSTSVNGRFTPACFPGRTTPDFRITTSLFEQQSTRASIISPLTVNGTGSDIIPIAVAFNETIHAYFKSGDISKFKVKCFGCMKISFPFAVLKFLNRELPLLEFRLSNLQIANQDLKTNNQLLSKVDSTPNLDSFQFKFSTPNLVQELKQQHQQNKLAAFFNFELLKYEFKYSTTPLVLNANWSNNPIDNTIELNLNYQFNFRKNLSQVNFMIVMPTGKQSTSATAPIDKISLIKSEPTALIQENDNKMQILWQFATLNTNGSLTAKFSIPTSFTLNQSFNSLSSINPLEHFYQPVYVKFNIENETLSQVKFEILSNSYKLSLLKERIETGKYFSNNDHQQTNNSITTETLNQNSVSSKKAPFAGSLSTSIGSTVDIFLNL